MDVSNLIFIGLIVIGVLALLIWTIGETAKSKTRNIALIENTPASASSAVKVSMLIKCPACQHNVSTGAISCPACGHVLTPLAQPKKWSPGVAAVLSLFIPGAGQIYKGKTGTGILWLVFVIGGYLLFIVPGLILHLICIINAASGDPTKN